MQKIPFRTQFTPVLMHFLFRFGLIILATATLARASFAERTEAMKLYDEGKYSEAQQAFLKLSEGKRSEVFKAEALRQAALCALKKGDAGEATKLALTIPIPAFSIFTQMEIAKNQRTWDELITLGNSTDIATWPEKLLYPTYVMMGEALLATEKPQLAQEAFAKAVESTVTVPAKSRALLMQGEALEQAGLPEDALTTYTTIVTLAPRGGGILQRAFLSKARVWTTQKNEEQALANLAEFEKIKAQDDYWIAAGHLAYGQVYEAFGKKDLAESNYKQALAQAKAPEELTAQARAGLKRLSAATTP